jgi:hypothetical protein
MTVVEDEMNTAEGRRVGNHEKTDFKEKACSTRKA